VRVLVTRPIEDAEETAARLHSRGHVAVIAPLLEVRFRDGPEIFFDGIQAIVATSANGIRALLRRTQKRDVRLFAVGPQTAAVAQAAGFVNVQNSQGDSIALADAISTWADRGKGALLHVAGNEATSKLAARLSEHGFILRRDVLYDVVPVAALPAEAVNALRNRELDAVLLFSPLSAQTFAQCVEFAGLQAASREMVAVCISQAAADQVAPDLFGETRIALRPSESEMIDALER
jgi:uroporphyrinogen-III synthase